MAKRRFAKSIIKNNPFKKLSAVFISLVLLFILSIVLYFVFNKYTVENFVAKRNPGIVVSLWTDNEGSQGNSFVTNEWLHIVNYYDKFATFKQGKLADFIVYAKDVTKGTNMEALMTDANIEVYQPLWRAQLPFVTCHFLENGRLSEGWRSPPEQAFFAYTELTSANITKYISTVSTKYHIALYTDPTYSNSSNSSTPQQVKDAETAVKTAELDANNANNANYP